VKTETALIAAVKREYARMENATVIMDSQEKIAPYALALQNAHTMVNA